MTTKKPAQIGLWLAAGIAVVFGALTIVAGGLALFGGPAAQAAAGNAVWFVLWFNFLSGFVYVLAGMGVALRKPWGRMLAVALALSIVGVFAMLGWHVLQGGAYEMRTVGAMGLRAAIWIAISVFLIRSQKIAG